MYNIKDVILRMKKISNIESNAQLARDLNVSYNTFNTWLKRNKFPQETIIDFANRYNTSLDYLIFGKSNNTNNSNLFTHNIETKDMITFYGQYEPLNISPNTNLHLSKKIFHSGGHYLIKQRDFYYIAQVFFNPFNETVTLKTSEFTHILNEEEFYNINLGLIKDISINKNS